MYIWIGILIDGQLDALRDRAIRIERELSLPLSCFTLPQHISLKISFFVDDADASRVIDSVEHFLEGQKPFSVEVRGIEREGNIVWVRMEEREELTALSLSLGKMLEREWGVGYHPYDLDFKFHSTLFMDDDPRRIAVAYERIKDTAVPERLLVDTFVIGTSHSGALGTYRVERTVSVR